MKVSGTSTTGRWRGDLPTALTTEIRPTLPRSAAAVDRQDPLQI
jgi:hypothetical protein